MRSGLIAMAVAALTALGGCAARQPVWQDRQRIVDVSGKETVGLGREAALQRMLAKSARIAVDHGYRYFSIIKPAPAANGTTILPPAGDVTIRLFRDNEARYPTPGLWDAYRLLSERAPKA